MYDDWPDDSICAWLEQKPTHEGYLGEAQKRELSCEGGVAIKTSSTTASSKSTTTTYSSTPSASLSSVWKDNGVSANVAKQLSRVGVNSSANWTGDGHFRAFDHQGNLPKVSNRNSDVEQVFSDGFSHLVYIVAFDRFFTKDCQLKRDYRPACVNPDRVVAKFTSIKKQILETLIKYPDAVFVISPKPGYEIFYSAANGMNQTYWHEAFENNKEAREAFNNLWGLISKVLSDVPDENLAFNLLNEPEFEQMNMWNKREIWQEWATEIVDVIRGVSPERTIIIEGIHKSLFARNNGPSNILTPIGRKNIVYGFHYYNEEWGKQDQSDKHKGVSGLPLPSLSKLKSNMQQLVDYTKHYKVPVVLTEIGVNGPCDGNGPLQKDRATYSSVVYETLVPNSIGITWWSLESHNNTPYQRISGDCYNDIHGKKLIPDKQLFKALRLTPILTTEVKQPAKAVVDALQIILDNEQIILDNEVKKEAERKAEKAATSDEDPTVSKVIEVIQGDMFIVDIAEPHELAGNNIKLFLRDIDAPNATKSCPKQMEFGTKVKDIVTEKLADASSIKLKNFRKTNTGVIAQVIVDGKDLGEELIAEGYASNEYGHWRAYFCDALQAMAAGDSNWKYGIVDVDKAIFWYERAIFLYPDRDKTVVTYDLSELYKMNGDTKKSMDYLKQSASLGWAQAEVDLGIAYLVGDGVAKDTSEAKYWLKKAHSHGIGRAELIYCSSLPKAKQKTCKF